MDRPEQIEKLLREAIREAKYASPWQLSLGYILAEQGKIEEAVKLFETVKKADELGPAEYRTLADWYMVVDRREDHEETLIEVFKKTDEWRLSNWLSQKLNPWQRSDGELPSELDKDVLRVFAALFQKSSYPANHLSRLRDFYRATHDFRLMEALGHGVIGHSAERVYPLLGGMGSVLGEVRNEATADSIVEHIVEVRARAKTDVDRRALDLLEMLVERRGAELLNQPGPHVEKALAAMQRAFKREWSPGEPRLVADLLAGLGEIAQDELAAEQLRQLEILHDRAEKGSVDRLHIGHAKAKTIWSYQRGEEAVDLLDDAIDE